MFPVTSFCSVFKNIFKDYVIIKQNILMTGTLQVVIEKDSKKLPNFQVPWSFAYETERCSQQFSAYLQNC